MKTGTADSPASRALRRIATGLACLALISWPAVAPASPERSFGVVTQRSAVLTARYWNPILAWVSARSGVELRLRLTRSGAEALEMVGRGEFDFVYTNHNFLPKNEPAGYRVIVRPRGNGIRGEVVVLDDAPVKSLGELAGREVAFPSRAAFVGYAVTMHGLEEAGVRVEPVFAGNQEGAMAQMKLRRVAAASVNSQVMREYAAREGVGYRVLWRSGEFPDIPVSAHPRVSASEVETVRAALAAMADDAEGARILAASAALVKERPPFGFEASSEDEYAGVRALYRGAAK